jgi:hypothetical protein
MGACTERGGKAPYMLVRDKLKMWTLFKFNFKLSVVLSAT